MSQSIYLTTRMPPPPELQRVVGTCVDAARRQGGDCRDHCLTMLHELKESAHNEHKLIEKYSFMDDEVPTRQDYRAMLEQHAELDKYTRWCDEVIEELRGGEAMELVDRPLLIDDFKYVAKGSCIKLWYDHHNCGSYLWEHHSVIWDGQRRRLWGWFKFEGTAWVGPGDYVYEHQGLAVSGSGDSV
jgi:hypothetical protein